MDIIYGNKKNFDELINNDLVLVDFFATWCGPCKMLSPLLEELSLSKPDLMIVKIDTDQNIELAQKFGIMVVPTLILFKKGTLVANKSGVIPKELLESWIKENI